MLQLLQLQTLQAEALDLVDLMLLEVLNIWELWKSILSRLLQEVKLKMLTNRLICQKIQRLKALL